MTVFLYRYRFRSPEGKNVPAQEKEKIEDAFRKYRGRSVLIAIPADCLIDYLNETHPLVAFITRIELGMPRGSILWLEGDHVNFQIPNQAPFAARREDILMKLDDGTWDVMEQNVFVRIVEVDPESKSETESDWRSEQRLLPMGA